MNSSRKNPGLKEANEAAAIGNIRTINWAQMTCSEGGNAPYAEGLDELTEATARRPPLLSGDWYNDVEKNGYIFTLEEPFESWCY